LQLKFAALQHISPAEVEDASTTMEDIMTRLLKKLVQAYLDSTEKYGAMTHFGFY
jgi:hypothetical protein